MVKAIVNLMIVEACLQDDKRNDAFTFVNQVDHLLFRIHIKHCLRLWRQVVELRQKCFLLFHLFWWRGVRREEQKHEQNKTRRHHSQKIITPRFSRSHGIYRSRLRLPRPGINPSPGHSFANTVFMPLFHHFRPLCASLCRFFTLGLFIAAFIASLCRFLTSGLFKAAFVASEICCFTLDRFITSERCCLWVSDFGAALLCNDTWSETVRKISSRAGT